MLNMPFKKSHDSQIPKITMLNLAEKSNRLVKIIDRYDKVSYRHEFSPTFKRNWTLSPRKHSKKSPFSFKTSPKKYEIFNNDEGNIDSYIKSILKEYHLDDIDSREQLTMRNQRYTKNAFDRFFGENGAIEEQRLVNYVNNCSIYN